MKTLDANNEYGVDDLVERLDQIQSLIASASTEEESATAFRRLTDLKSAAQSIYDQISSSSEEDAEDEDIDIDEVESLIESLLKKDEEGQFGVQDMAEQLAFIKKKVDNTDDEDELAELESQLKDLYSAALSVDEELSNTNE